MVRRMRQASISSELLMCSGGLFMSDVVTVLGSVGMFIV